MDLRDRNEGGERTRERARGAGYEFRANALIPTFALRRSALRLLSSRQSGFGSFGLYYLDINFD
eukprot:scaffold1178_cov252-Pinguiococcus_pyrenoidosus.AAC.11